MKKYRKYLYIAVGVIALLSIIRMIMRPESMLASLILLLAVVLVVLAMWLISRNDNESLRHSRRRGAELEQQVETLKREVASLTRELDEKDRSKLNVVGLSPILHLAVLNIDSSFVRTFIREDHEAGLTFNGALRADICAEYGIKLEEVGFRYDEAANVLYLANFRPGLLSFSKKQLTWEIANSFASRSFFGRSYSSASHPAAKAFTNKMSHELRDALEKEIDERKIQEFEWLSPMISQQVTDMLKLLVGRPGLQVVTFEGLPEGDYISFPEFREQFSAQIPAQTPEQIESK